MLGFGAIAELAIADLPRQPEAIEPQYARAPAGNGYTPRRAVISVRPPAIQETIR